ncbi:MAG: chemotaxis protein CheB [Ginsengibacter sp.]
MHLLKRSYPFYNTYTQLTIEDMFLLSSCRKYILIPSPGGLLERKLSGARTIAQDEKSCNVSGMPGEAIMMNAVDKICRYMKLPAM